MSASPTFARIRRQVLARGLTKLPQCPHCKQEIPLLQYAAHVSECGKPAPEPPPAAQAPTSEANGATATPRHGLIYGLFDKGAVARLEHAGEELAQLRQQLRDEHGTTTAQQRVERCREIARVECLFMALVVDQLRVRFRNQGSGMVFLRNLRPHVVDDGLRQSCVELTRMADPAVWRTS